METTTLEDLREQIRREERVAGLRGDGYVSDAAIRRRRRQIALVAAVVFLGLVVTTVANDVWVDLKRNSSIVDPQTARFGMLVFTIAFIAYALEKELHLRRLSTLGHEAQALNLVLADRILETAALAEAERVIDGSLELGDVLDAVLEQALSLVVAANGSVSLLMEDGELREVAGSDGSAVGHAPRVADAIVMQVALAREPMLVSGPVPLELDGSVYGRARLSSALCAPLEHEGVLLGVVTLGAPPNVRFGDTELEIVRRFAPRAAAAIARARRFEAAVLLLDSTGDPRTEEIRRISNAIRQAASALRDEGDPRRRLELLDVVEGGAVRLLAATR
ncbi:MAG TPA: GAF domain-containing protein [Acidimicrobiia bacterium]|jgi:GAF domain-containing protein